MSEKRLSTINKINAAKKRVGYFQNLPKDLFESKIKLSMKKNLLKLLDVTEHKKEIGVVKRNFRKTDSPQRKKVINLIKKAKIERGGNLLTYLPNFYGEMVGGLKNCLTSKWSKKIMDLVIEELKIKHTLPEITMQSLSIENFKEFLAWEDEENNKTL